MRTRLICLTVLCMLCVGTTKAGQERKSVIAGGETIGVCIMTDGLLVVDTTSIIDENGNKIQAADNAGIRKGDRIMSADGNCLESSAALLEYVIDRHNDMVLTIKRNNETVNTVITPVKTTDGYRLGMWVRDSTAGIGTVTYIDPKDGSYGALGHGVSDTDTGILLAAREGSILKCSIGEPTKGTSGEPGELNGYFIGSAIGTLTSNSEHGIFGKLHDYKTLFTNQPLGVAFPEEIKTGKAVILADVDGHGVKEYEIEIKKINAGNREGKNIVFKVSDNALIEKTGGIVQGMSGAPIIQNKMLVGAVTHVFVNDPRKGYGILAEYMIN